MLLSLSPSPPSPVSPSAFRFSRPGFVSVELPVVPDPVPDPVADATWLEDEGAIVAAAVAEEDVVIRAVVAVGGIAAALLDETSCCSPTAGSAACCGRFARSWARWILNWPCSVSAMAASILLRQGSVWFSAGLPWVRARHPGQPVV